MEQSFVAWAKVRARRLPKVKLGIGDDAAILAASSGDSVVTTDSQMDGVHFRLSEVSPRAIGRKLVNVNLSDLAAMAATPEAAFLSLCLPEHSSTVGHCTRSNAENESGSTEEAGSQVLASDALAAEIYEGVCDALADFGVALAGGDTNCWPGPLVLHLTAIGETTDDVVWTRDGAKPDDLIVVTGPVGGSLLGKHLDFEPRLDIAEKLRNRKIVNAAMDISDGLSVDLLRMCDASHCGAILNLENIPIADAAYEMAKQSGKLPIEHALGDGEDFELLLSIPADRLGELREAIGEDSVHICGEFTSRTGLWAREGGKIRQLTSSGYVHGR